MVGSLLHGLYDDEGRLNHVGFSSGLKSGQKATLTDKLEAKRLYALFGSTKTAGWSKVRIRSPGGAA